MSRPSRSHRAGDGGAPIDARHPTWRSVLGGHVARRHLRARHLCAMINRDELTAPDRCAKRGHFA